ncbi:MAG: hypothetical protein GXC73_01480 [Chitinophagaceae bacterium]|nr:hypothetical protein [Chitinophagaceae bacterium]
MSCHFQTLYCGEDGYVVYCNQCGQYQLAYLCVMLTLEEKDFHSFRRTIQQQYKHSLQLSNEHCKCVVVQTAAAGTHFLFSGREIKRFNELLDEADTEQQAQSMLALFQQ